MNIKMYKEICYDARSHERKKHAGIWQETDL